MNNRVWAAGSILSLLISSFWACVIDQPVLTYGNNPNEVTFSIVGRIGCNPWPFVTLNNLEDGSSLKLSAFTFKDYGVLITNQTYSRTGYFFTAQVLPQTRYSWTASGENLLGPFEFTMKNYSIDQRSANTENKEVKLIVIADADVSNQSMVTFRALSNLNLAKYDGIIHAGDLAYEIQSDVGLRGDTYFNTISGLVARIPYLVIGGNHELYDNTNLFNYRLRMPNYSDNYANNVFYKVIHNALFVFINYDYIIKIYPGKYNEVLLYIDEIFKRAASNPNIKWRAVVSHRPIFCGGMAEYDCFINPLWLKPFDDLYRKHKVDVILQAHEHFYERMKFSKDFSIKSFPSIEVDGTTQYTDASEPLSIISGLAGNTKDFQSGQSVNKLNEKFFSFIQSYLEVRITETTFQIISQSCTEKRVLDSVRLVKTFVPAVDPSFGFTSIRFWGAIGLFLLLVVVVVGITYFWKMKKPEKIEQSYSISSPGTPDSNSDYHLAAESTDDDSKDFKEEHC